MNTEIWSCATDSTTEIIARAKEILERGGLVAFPTETVYGLGGDALNPEASKKIYAAKGRPSDNPLIVHIGDFSQIPALVSEIPDQAEKLMKAFWPGPLTVILKKADGIPKETTGGLSTVAIRMPAHPFANALLRKTGMPVAAPSANRSGRPSTTKASHVIEDLMGRVDMIIDGGDVPIGVESTIIDLTGEVPMLLRPGYITVAEMEAVIGPVETDPAIRNENIISHAVSIGRPKAPGMKYRHYAPKAEMTVVTGEAEAVAEAINALSGGKTGILTVEEHRHLYKTGHPVVAGSLKDPESIAHGLFSALREFDALGVENIYAEDFSEADIGTAVMNRLLKAAGGNFKSVSELRKENK